MTLLVIDPYLVHAYWDLDRATLPEASSAVLRVYDTTEGVSGFFDVPVSLPVRNWYIHLWTPERSYYAELGLIEEGGGFTRLARSNTIQTPRAWPVSAVPAATPVEPLQAEPEDSVPAAEVVPPRESAPAPLPDGVPSGPGAVSASEHVNTLPNRAQRAPRQGAVSGDIQEPLVAEQAPFPPPRIAEPVDAARLLRTRLEEIYSLLEWTPPAGEAAELPAPGHEPSPSTAAQPNQPTDLTQIAEEHFTAGVSSKPPKPPA